MSYDWYIMNAFLGPRAASLAKKAHRGEVHVMPVANFMCLVFALEETPLTFCIRCNKLRLNFKMIKIDSFFKLPSPVS